MYFVLSARLFVAVLGAGVSGPSVVYLLSNTTRHSVTVFASCFSLNTTSVSYSHALASFCSLATKFGQKDALQCQESE